MNAEVLEDYRRSRRQQAEEGKVLDDLQLTGFEDDETRRLIEARVFLRQANTPTIKPLLPLLLNLKGKPYKLTDHFPFEPFFRTRMAQTTMLKTGRQVSKCFFEDEPVLLPDGTEVPAKNLRVGDIILSWSKSERQFIRRRIVNVWRTGIKPLRSIWTSSGFRTRITADHRLLVRDGDNHTEAFREARHIYLGDYLAVRVKDGTLAWERITGNCDGGEGKTLDFEVEAATDDDHNFVLGKCVSHNSTSLAAQGIVFSNSNPFRSTLYVTPLFEMIRRFSHNYVREFIENSPVKRLFTSTRTSNQILQRSFVNGSSMIFSYAFLDAERTRGIPADRNVIDEVQDLVYDFLQIIHETLSGSNLGLKQYAGTPKSLDNTVEKLWTDSSQAEWMMKCLTAGCGHWNVPALSHDLYDMIHPWHSEISETNPGIRCAKCGKAGSLNPRMGRWVHAFKERRWSFAGYHVPQVIMPMHYASQEKWDILIGKQSGKNNTTQTTFFNEVCGESSDAGAKLVTVTDLKAAAILPWQNKANEAAKQINRYKHRVLSVDWGGGGGRLRKSGGSGVRGKDDDRARMRTSFTTLAVMGVKYDGSCDVLWGHRSVRTHDWLYEAQLCIEAIKKFQCSHFAHDYSNAGEGRMLFMKQAGFPERNILNMRYHGILHNRIAFHPATKDNPYPYYSLDKAQTLATVCLAIKYQLIRFFQYDYRGSDDVGLLHDFLALVEEKIDSRLGTDNSIITRNPNMPDDFAHSVNMGAHALWLLARKWPNFAEAARFRISEEMLKHIHPTHKIDWNDF